jgi:chemotaxis protein CheX
MQTSKGSAIIELPEVLDSTTAAPLVVELQNLRGQPLEIGARSVGRVSTLCIQVLLSAATTWLDDNVAFQICAPSEAILEAIRILGLSEDQFAIARNVI